jgi:hypothetical protein
MPRQPNAPPGDRIFGRIDKMHVACPDCGEVVQGGLTARAQGGKDAEDQILGRLSRKGKLARGVRGSMATAYNPVTSTLRCPFCYSVFQVGILLWPIGIGRQQYLIPSDQRPSKSQLRRLRALATGIVAIERKRRGDPVNLYVTSECVCPAGGWRVNCPIHGDRVQGGSQHDDAQITDDDDDNNDT